MKRRYFAYTLLALSIITAFFEYWDIDRRVESCIESMNVIEKDVRQDDYYNAAQLCEKLDKDFTEIDSNIMFCYYKHDELEKVDSKLVILDEYLKQRDKINCLASSREIIKMLTVLKEREQINLKNIL